LKNQKARLRVGLKAQVVKQVPFEWTIAHYDARLPAVFSTPAMIGMMETAAAIAVQPKLAPGTITVGTRIEVDHVKAVGVGARVAARARLTEIRGRFLAFEVEARAGRVVIGRGRVYRAIVEPRGFHDKAAKRK
jgi:predicted thioesterase